MSLKIDIKEIFRKNTGYAEPEHAINQAESLKSLSVDLYTDSKRFVYELLQNADDSVISGNPVKVGIRLFDDFLVVAHTGKPFDKRDLRGICGVSDGTKKNLVEKTGYKGIGFKAVFGQSNKVTIYTNGDYFRFDSDYDFPWNNKWGENQQVWEEENERQFSYPWQIIPIYTCKKEVDERINSFLNDGEWTVATIVLLSKGKSDVKKAIEKLSSNVNMFLFLKNIQELDFNLGTPNIITLHRDQESEIVKIKQNGTIKASWLLKTITLPVPDNIKSILKEERNIPDKLLNAKNTELTFAAKIGEEGIKKLEVNERLLYSYLPTEESKYTIPVLVNSSFVIGANRETLHESSKWNEWLFQVMPLELLKWVADLVKSDYGDQAYELIPIKPVGTNSLDSFYLKGLKDAINKIPFILSNKRELLKVNEVIIDFTSLSKKKFITEDVIRGFVITEFSKKTINSHPFLPFTRYVTLFKNIGVSCFEMNHVSEFLKSDVFLKSHSIVKNIQLIKYFKELSERKDSAKISIDIIKNLPFIFDHKKALHKPNNIYFPTPDDDNWNDPNSEISFLHGDIQKFLLDNPETRIWLESMGVIEKTDLTYLRKTIIENASTYCTHDNSEETILNIFSLYKKREIGEEELGELSELKILTEKGRLLPAKSCYFSDSYFPRLKLQSFLSDDIFVSKEYMKNVLERDEWKRFFKMMGVSEGITPVSFDKNSSTSLIQEHKFKEDYFEEDNKFFTPWQTKFKANEYSKLISFIFLAETSKYIFSKLFWNDIVNNLELPSFDSDATAYWGRCGYAGRSSGDDVGNYIGWYIKNNECIPTSMKTCHKSNNVFVNSEDIVKIAGSYLPVFCGDELSQDFKAFFSFRTSLELSDYLDLLKRISLDLTTEGEIKRVNIIRIQSIYKVLLDLCDNWSSDEISQVKNWADTGTLLGTKRQFIGCNTLNYFLDGNESIFQDQFHFLDLNPKYKNHPQLEKLLFYFKVKILKQSDFELVPTQDEACSGLISHLKIVIPFFKIWIDNELRDTNISEDLENLQNEIDVLNICQAKELKIKYKDIDFTKSVNVHFDEENLFVTKPWNSNSVLLKLSEILCRYLNLVGHDKKLDFLLRSSCDEIQKYFIQEDVEIPNEVLEISENSEVEVEIPKIKSFADIQNAITTDNITADYFHISKNEFDLLEYVEKLISRAVSNVINYLKKLPEYNCTNWYQIANSIIGGVIKNGNEITIVARPSDNDEVLLYYTSEFDVLEYVDAEFWCEDGKNIPKQITLGQLLKKTGINRIPVRNIDISSTDLEILISDPKSKVLDFNAVPFVPQKIARIISSFANTDGGTLIFGLKEVNTSTNKIVGLSSDFRIDEITRKAISLLSPIPIVTYDWFETSESSIFVIKTEKADNDIFFKSQKYIRNGACTILSDTFLTVQKNINATLHNNDIALIIGIEDYAPKEENRISSVKYAKADVLKFKDMLINHMHIKEDNIYMYLNEKALGSTLKYDLYGFFNSLTKEDRLIFYYVGHGFHNGITNYLSTYDMHQFHIAETAISLRECLIDPLLKSKCDNALIFIDACAQSFQNDNERSQVSDINDEELILLTNDFPCYATFLSCQPGQSSYSSDILKNGIWTHHLVNALSCNVSEAIYKNKYVTDRLLQDYLSKSVTKYTKEELKYDQNPKAILDSSNENVIVEIIPEEIE